MFCCLTAASELSSSVASKHLEPDDRAAALVRPGLLCLTPSSILPASRRKRRPWLAIHPYAIMLWSFNLINVPPPVSLPLLRLADSRLGSGPHPDTFTPCQQGTSKSSVATHVPLARPWITCTCRTNVNPTDPEGPCQHNTAQTCHNAT